MYQIHANQYAVPGIHNIYTYTDTQYIYMHTNTYTGSYYRQYTYTLSYYRQYIQMHIYTYTDTPNFVFRFI